MELGKDNKVSEVCKRLETTEQMYYRWRQKVGGTQPEMAKQLKALEQLNKLVTNQGLDTKIFKEASEASKENW